MKNLEETIQMFEKLQLQINNAQFGEFETNRSLFNQLKNLLIENGFDIDIITIDHLKKFFTPHKDYHQLYDNPNESFKDDQGKLAALCTKAIRDLGKKRTAAKNKMIAQPQGKAVIKIETVYPPTSWKLIRNGLFWMVFGLALTLSCAVFYYIGQNSKDKENAELVVNNGEKNIEVKELNKNLEEVSLELDNCLVVVKQLKSILSISKEENTNSEITKK